MKNKLTLEEIKRQAELQVKERFKRLRADAEKRREAKAKVEAKNLVSQAWAKEQIAKKLAVSNESNKKIAKAKKEKLNIIAKTAADQLKAQQDQWKEIE
jgi:hypothetical protein